MEKSYNINGRKMIFIGDKLIDYNEYNKINQKKEKTLSEMKIENASFEDVEFVERVYKEDLKQIGYGFDKFLKKYGYKIINVDNNYWQYKLVSKDVKFDMGKDNFPMNATIENFELVPISNEEFYDIKSKCEAKEQNKIYIHTFKSLFNSFILRECYLKELLKQNSNEELNKLNKDLNKLRAPIYKLIRYADYSNRDKRANIPTRTRQTLILFERFPSDLKEELFQLFNEYLRIYSNTIKIKDMKDMDVGRAPFPRDMIDKRYVRRRQKKK